MWNINCYNSLGFLCIFWCKVSVRWIYLCTSVNFVLNFHYSEVPKCWYIHFCLIFEINNNKIVLCIQLIILFGIFPPDIHFHCAFLHDTRRHLYIIHFNQKPVSVNVLTDFGIHTIVSTWAFFKLTNTLNTAFWVPRDFCCFVFY